jgi:hypothetical protein
MTPEEIDTIIAAVDIEPRDRRQLNVLLERVRLMIPSWRENKTNSYGLTSLRQAIEEVARMVESNPDAISLEPGIAAVIDEARRLEAVGRRLSVMDVVRGSLLAQLFELQSA